MVTVICAFFNVKNEPDAELPAADLCQDAFAEDD